MNNSSIVLWIERTMMTQIVVVKSHRQYNHRSGGLWCYNNNNNIERSILRRGVQEYNCTSSLLSSIVLLIL